MFDRARAPACIVCLMSDVLAHGAQKGRHRESLGGSGRCVHARTRMWRFVWFRASAFTILAAMRLGLDPERRRDAR
jgi:hypothetical protein